MLVECAHLAAGQALMCHKRDWSWLTSFAHHIDTPQKNKRVRFSYRSVQLTMQRHPKMRIQGNDQD